jgi:flagellar hook-basal body complex protein FliE
MTVMPIMPLPPPTGIDPVMAPAMPMSIASMPTLQAPGTNTVTPGFGQMVTQGIEAVNRQLIGSETDLQEMAAGTEQNLHRVMIRMEDARLSFQLLMQVRNRLLEAYQDVMKMQV